MLAVRLWTLRTGAHFIVAPTARPRLEAIVLAATSPQRHVRHARIILLSADAIGTGSIMVRTGKSKTCVWRWQERFMSEGVDGLLHAMTRPPGIPKTATDKVSDDIRLTQGAAQPQDVWHGRRAAKPVQMAT